MRVTASLLALTLVGCGGGSDLVLDLRTDLAPGDEFDRIEADVFTAEGERLAELRIDADLDADYGEGDRLAEVGSLEPGPIEIRTRLLTGERLVAERPLLVEVAGEALAVTILITRACRGVSCPSPDLACVAGGCVDPTCAPETPDSCTEEPECASDADCEVPTCASARCVAGVCLSTPVRGACAPGERCLRSSGCVAIEPTQFGGVAPIAGLGDPIGDDDPTLTGDLLEMVFNRDRALYGTSRPSVTAPWSAPAPIAELNVVGIQQSDPVLSLDGLFIAFGSRAAVPGSFDVYVSSRASRGDGWDPPVLVDTTVSPLSLVPFFISDDGLSLYLGEQTDADRDVLVARRASLVDPFGVPGPFDPLAEPDRDERNVHFFEGDTRMIFTLGPLGFEDLFVASRAAAGAAFGPPAALDALDTGVDDSDPWVSPDGSYLVFMSTRDGASRIYEAYRE